LTAEEADREIPWSQQDVEDLALMRTLLAVDRPTVDELKELCMTAAGVWRNRQHAIDDRALTVKRVVRRLTGGK
jgi:hypothetical protein